MLNIRALLKCKYIIFRYNSTFFAHIIKADKGGIMDDKFLCGMLLGVIGGAVIATNSAKARQMVKDGQTQVKEKMEEVSSSSKKQQ